MTCAGSQNPLRAKNVGRMSRDVNESATANGSTPPPAIKPMGDEIRASETVMVGPAPPLSGMGAVLVGKTERTMFGGGNEHQDLPDRRILCGQMLHGIETLGKHAGA